MHSSPDLPDKSMLSRLLAMALPMVISQGAFALMIFTDRLFLAQLSPAHMAAAMGGGVAWFFSFSLFSGTLAYATALVAQYLGARELHKCSKVITQGVLLALVCTPVLFLIGFAMRGIFAFMEHSPEQVVLEQGYFDILMWSGFFILGKTTLSAFFSGIGRTRVVMVCEVLGICINIPLSYLLIFGKLGLPALGMTGAAVGTVLSMILVIGFYLVFYLAQHNRERFSIGASLVFDPGITRRYVRLGFPSGLEMFLNVAAFNLFLLMFHSYGIAQAASATIVFSWDILSFVPLLGLNIAVMSLVGRAVGARDMDNTQEVMKAGYLLGMGYSLVLALCFLLFRHSLVDMFIFDEQGAAEIRALAGFMMVGLSFYVLLEGVLQVAAGVLRGAGDTHWCMWASVSLHWAMLIVQFLLIRVLQLGPRISWIAFVVMIFLIVVVFLWRLHSGRWRDPARLSAVMAE